MTMRAYMKIPGSMGFESTVPFECKESPLWFHVAGISETASGYGVKLTSPYMVKVRGKWRRVYYYCMSNVATLYIGKPGAWEYVVETIDMESE